MSATIRKQSATPPADMQWRARNIAMQASKLASQAGPTTQRVAATARQSAASTADWARPRVGEVRVWMAARAARGSVAVSERVAPWVSSMLATAARKLDPPKDRSRRWPKVLAGMTMLAAGGAAAASAAIRGRQGAVPMPMPPRPPARGTAESSTVLNPSAEGESAAAEADADGVSPSR